MSRKYKFGDSDQLYFISYAVVFWIDVFTRSEYCDIVVRSWQYCQDNKGLSIYAWIIMPSHVHLIVGTEKNSLEDIIRDMKSFTSNQLKKAIFANNKESRKDWMTTMMGEAGKNNSNNRGWQFWRQNNKPLEIRTTDQFFQAMNYIHDNPVTSGLVRKPEDWKYSSAGDFYGEKGAIELSYIS